MTAKEYNNFISRKELRCKPKHAKKSKYKNVKVEFDGKVFHSIKEKNRYIELLSKITKGEISCLQTQQPFEVLPATDLHRAVIYKADFTYIDVRTGKLIVEDVKPFDRKTQKFRFKSDYILKKKMLYYFKRIKLKEV